MKLKISKKEYEKKEFDLEWSYKNKTHTIIDPVKQLECEEKDFDFDR